MSLHEAALFFILMANVVVCVLSSIALDCLYTIILGRGIDAGSYDNHSIDDDKYPDSKTCECIHGDDLPAPRIQCFELITHTRNNNSHDNKACFVYGW